MSYPFLRQPHVVQFCDALTRGESWTRNQMQIVSTCLGSLVHTQQGEQTIKTLDSPILGPSILGRAQAGRMIRWPNGWVAALVSASHFSRPPFPMQILLAICEGMSTKSFFSIAETFNPCLSISVRPIHGPRQFCLQCFSTTPSTLRVSLLSSPQWLGACGWSRSYLGVLR